MEEREYSSFRDPAGYVFRQDRTIYRRVLPAYERQYRKAGDSRLYERCIAEKLLLPFEVLEESRPGSVAVLRPRPVPVLSYPYEWCFEQLKDAAITTLQLHLRALEHEMLLKDASAYNIQFVDGRAHCIDHLSFDFVAEHAAWPAYGQFCRQFLAPLALMSYVDPALAKMAQLFMDGVPLDLASALLPWRTRLRPSLYMHIHLHARFLGTYGDTRKQLQARRISIKDLTAIAQSLLSAVRRLAPNRRRTEWAGYYDSTNYSQSALEGKKQLVREMVSMVRPATVWDIGGNNGMFSRAIADLAQSILCMDIDPLAVNENYLICKKSNVPNILPIVADFTNPSPAIGFANKERLALKDRGRPDLILALALIHHLAIGNNLPLRYVAEHLAERCDHLIIEFVPKSNSQVQRLLLNRPDIFADYNEEQFVAAFDACFSKSVARTIPGTERTLFLMRRKGIGA